MSGRKIGILGGVFDPVHCGHLSVAALAKDYFKLDTMIFIPSSAPPHKSAVAATVLDRLNMLTLALEGTDGCRIWDGEIKREGYSYTIDTLNELDKEYPDSKFYFIIGADNLAEIHKWRSYKDILKKVTLCATARPGYELICPDELIDADLKIFPGPEWGLSSTKLREYLRDGLNCKYLIPDAVLAYIKEKRLYNNAECRMQNESQNIMYRGMI